VVITRLVAAPKGRIRYILGVDRCGHFLPCRRKIVEYLSFFTAEAWFGLLHIIGRHIHERRIRGLW
jgi:hypothetical protein